MTYASRTAWRKSSSNSGSEFAALRSRKLRLLIPLTVAFAFMIEQLDSTIITTAIPDIARSLKVPVLQMNLAITSYILSLAVFIPVSGWFADRFGARRVFVTALLLFTAASALCGLCDTLPELVAARLLQGFGGAMMTPVGRLILLRSFPRSQLATAMTYMTIPAVIGPTMGPLLGGAITTYVGWRWLFYVNIPLGLLGVALALRVVEDTRLAGTPGFDMLGFVACGAGLAGLQFALEMVGRPILPAIVYLGNAGGRDWAAGCLWVVCDTARRSVAGSETVHGADVSDRHFGGRVEPDGRQCSAVHAAADAADRVRFEPGRIGIADLRHQPGGRGGAADLGRHVAAVGVSELCWRGMG